MEETELKKILDLHKIWVESGGNAGENANLRNADLRGANLRSADLDFSCWPLWCGSLGVKVDKKIAVQLAYHLCSLDCDDGEYVEVRKGLLEFANQMHRQDVKRLE